MHYLTVLGHTLQTKNKLELAVLKHLQSIDRTLISDKDFAVFRRTIKQNVEGYNAEYPRCKPVVLDWDKGYEHANDVIVRTNFTNFYLYAEKI